MIVAGTVALAGLLLVLDNTISQWLLAGVLLPFKIMLWPFRIWLKKPEPISMEPNWYQGEEPKPAPAMREIPIHAPPAPAPRAARTPAAPVPAPAPPAPSAPSSFKVNLPIGAKTKPR